ncbi:TolB family protein [Roseivirga sp. 4D4]|uniref:TolB family protein n=1 Tax=Roseivirga sp. 4D4 TaxID=1889784 RepID=UPI0009F4B257|nr:PD40 domain-containing protein [Roseivirga sp. 4D4]
MKKLVLLLSLAFLGCTPKQEAISEFPEGLRIAFVSNQEGSIDIYSMKPDGSNLKKITDTPERNSFPEYIDSETLRFTRVDSNNVYRKFEVSLKDGSVIPFVMDTVYSGADFQWFSKDSSRVVFRKQEEGVLELFLMNRDGSDLKRITQNKENGTPALLPNPYWNSDESKIAYMNGPDYYNQFLKIYDIETETTQIITPRGYMNSGMFWHSDDEQFTLNIKVRDSTTYELWNINASNSNMIPLTDNPGLGNIHPKLSPDGEWIVFESARDDREGDIFIMRPDGSDLRKLTQTTSYEGRPEWIIVK